MNQSMQSIDKAKYRKVYLEKRKMLSESDFDDKNYNLLYHFEKFVFDKSFEYCHSFLSIAQNNEVNTWPLIECLKAYDNKIVVSRSSIKENTLTHYQLDNHNQLEINKWGIPEPTQGTIIEVNKIDLVLIPLIVFDKSGHRIGYGKGYYDRFLDECRTDCLKIGLSLAPPLDNIPFTEEHDVPMDYCITPLGVYTFNK